MDFKDATDRLTVCVRLADLAQAMGISEAAVVQARMSEDASGFRRSPPGWEQAVARLARGRSRELDALADELER
jgi:putative heme degradation protein